MFRANILTLSVALNILLHLPLKRSTWVIFLKGKRRRRNLFGFEAREAEHPDLVGDMLPVVGGAFIFQTSHQLFPHLNDAVGHAVHLLQPFI